MKYLKNLLILYFCLLSILITNTFAIEKNTVWIHNIKHTITNRTVNFTWEAISGNNQADMYIWTPETQVFKLVNTIDVFKKQASLQINWNGDYVVRFMPLGWWNDIRYTFSISGSKNDQKEIKVVPKTGTTSNVLLILSLSILWYMVYRWRKTLKTN